MEHDPGSEERLAAERAFHKFMFEGRDMTSVEFDRLCEEHPDIGRELRSLRDQWAAVAGSSPSLHERIEDQYGKGARADVSLSTDSTPTPGSQDRPGSDSLIQRLKLHRGQKDRYEVDREINRGGMGAILRVHDGDLRRDLAMKVMLDKGYDQGAKRARQVRRFLEEAQIMGQLDHPGILPVHELGLSSDGQLFFTMPLVRGVTLQRVFKELSQGQGGRSLARVLRMIQNVCEAMAYAHTKGVVHRDLKPSNVMIGRFGETYVMDWGLAHVEGREDLHAESLRVDEASVSHVSTDRNDVPGPAVMTAEGDVMGTPEYMPPEQAHGRIDALGPRSDVYSAGAMLYHLLAGHAPYQDQERLPSKETLQRVKEGPPRALAEIAPSAPPELVALCEKAMARRPEDRYADMTELAEDLHRYQENRRVLARTFNAAYALRLAFQRNRAAVLTAAALLVVLVGVTVAFIRELQGEIEVSNRRLHVLNARAYIEEEQELYPIEPETVPAMDGWLGKVDRLLAQRDRYDAQELTASVEAGERADVEELEDNLARLSTLRNAVLERRGAAERLLEDSIEEEAWARYGEQIVSDYGFAVPPQRGLVPLGASRESGLWEFWHVLSGERPDWAPDGFEVDGDDGIVLVLLEGGSFVMGSPEDELYREPARETEHVVTLLPFFLSKFETTQGQWERIMGHNPSFRLAGTQRDGEHFTLSNPVETVTWHECSEAAGRVGLTLPTEAQWEYSCRAGGRTMFAHGDDYTTWHNMENLFQEPRDEDDPRRFWWDDGFIYTAPVGSFPPNGFGLHDMVGNVNEWCRESFADYPEDNYEPSDGALPASNNNNRLARGASYFTRIVYARSALRQSARPSVATQIRGARLARPLAE